MRARGAPLALALAVALAGACRPAGPQPGAREPDPGPPARPEAGALPRAGVDVRIGLAVDEESVVVGGTGPFELVEVDGTVLYVARAGQALTVRAAPGGLFAEVGGRRVGPLERLTRIRPEPGTDGRLLLDDREYRGSFFVVPADGGGLTLVNTLDLEQYLLGVVPREIPSLEFEAVKAQAVAARTYAVGHLGPREALGFDFHPTVADQVYGGASAEDAMASRAIAATTGEILVHEGRPIMAYYHSTCGGRTAAIDEVWNAAPQPYLKSVSDAEPGGGYYCDNSNRFRWTESWSEEQLLETLGRTLVSGDDIDAVQDVRVVERTTSGRVETLRIEADGRTYEVHGDSTRRVLLTAEQHRLLNSSRFELDRDERDGRVVRLTAHGGGWGHGIGMCQMGAIGRAAAGQDYRRILTSYYRGARVERLD